MQVLTPPGEAGKDKIGCQPHLFLLFSGRYLPANSRLLRAWRAGKVSSLTLRARKDQRSKAVPSDFVRGLKCRLCGKEYPLQALNFCTEDFGPLEGEYNYDAIGQALSRAN